MTMAGGMRRLARGCIRTLRGSVPGRIVAMGITRRGPTLEPEQDRGQREHPQVVGGPLLVAGGDPAPLLEPVDQPLDHVALPVGLPIEGPIRDLVGLRR